MKLALVIAFASSSAAFAPASKGAAKTALSAEKSPAVPFLPYPGACKGYIGEETGFDPLGLSSYFPMDYLREAELKHCRIAMLAIVGFIATDIGVRLPMFEGVSSASAHSIGVEKGALGLVALVASAFEMVSWIAVQEMLQGSGREPGYFGFGSKYLEGKSDEEVKLIKYKELKNGRLAMFAIGGAATQAVLTGHGFPYL